MGYTVVCMERGLESAAVFAQRLVLRISSMAPSGRELGPLSLLQFITLKRLNTHAGQTSKCGLDGEKVFIHTYTHTKKKKKLHAHFASSLTLAASNQKEVGTECERMCSLKMF